MFLRSCIFCMASATSSSAQAESTTGLILPSFHSPKILSTVERTYSEPSCWYSRWRRLNPARLLFSSNSLIGETLSTCHHERATLKKLFVSPVTTFEEP
uniref:Putative secreted protein n=1 Tax=Anopheles triannulatus TaxID=58253 RepID=A0A2M4B609_9DIPT